MSVVIVAAPLLVSGSVPPILSGGDSPCRGRNKKPGPHPSQDGALLPNALLLPHGTASLDPGASIGAV